MAFDVGSIVATLELKKAQWNKAIKEAEGDTKSFTGFVSKNSDAIKKMGRTMTIAGAAITGALGLMVKSAVTFNKEMANVATLLPGQSERIKELKKNVQDLAIAYGKSTTDISGGLYQVVSAFGDASDTARKLEINVKAAAAGMATTTDAINLTSAVTKGYGDVTADAVQKAADLAFVTVKLGQTTFPELAASIGRIIPNAAKLKVSQEELFAVMSTLTGVTGNANEVSTQFAGILRGMMKPTTDMAKAIENMGFSSAETMIAELGLVGSLRELMATTDGTAQGAAKLYQRTEALTAIFALVGEQADVFDMKLEAMRDTSGSLDEAFKEISEGINEAGFNMERLKQMTVVLTQRLGDKLAPTIGKMVVSIGKIVDKITTWIDKHPKLTTAIIKMTAALGAMMLVFGPMLMILPKIVSGFVALKKAKLGAALAGQFKGVNAQITGLKGVMGKLPAVAAAAFVGWKIGRLIGEVTGLDKGLQKLFTRLFKGKKFLQDDLVPGITKVNEAYGKLRNEFKFSAKEIGNLKRKYGDVVTALEAVESGLEVATKKTKAETKAVEDLTVVIKKAKKELKNIATTIMDTAVPASRDLSAAFETATDKMEEDFDDFGETVQTTFVEVKNYTDQLIDGMGNAFGSFVANVLTKGTSLKDSLKTLWGDMKRNFIGMIADMAKDWAVGFVKKIITGALTANKAIEKSDKVFQSMGKSVAGIGEGIGKLISNLAKGIGTAIETIAKSIANAAKSLAAAAPQLMIVGAVALALFAGFKAIQSLFGGGGGKAQDKATEMLQDIRNKTFDIFNGAQWMWKVIIGEQQARLGDHSQKLNWIVDQNKEMISIQSRSMTLLEKISNFTELTANALKNMPTAATGGYFPNETIVKVSERAPEAIGTIPQLQNAFGGGGAGGKDVNVNISLALSPTFNTLDPMTMREVWRESIEPEMIDSLSNKGRGLTAMKEALGLAT